VRPLVVTLAIDDPAQHRFDDERRRYFPADRYQVGAHLTLFHALPGEEIDTAARDLHRCTGASFELTVTDVISLGRGVAYLLASSDLVTRHRQLQRSWRDMLTAQDRQPLRPHITVQNKVAPDVARSTLAALRGIFTPFAVNAIGYDVWRYDGGPWSHVTRIPFESP